jgi:hypothetical protein
MVVRITGIWTITGLEAIVAICVTIGDLMSMGGIANHVSIVMRRKTKGR